jgi:NTP pyrophosphatase (non-canonical NTP hydrolase)
MVIDESKRPKSLEGFQKMFEEIYPSSTRTLDHAGVHMAEEMGEFSEAIMFFRGGHRDEDFKAVKLEAADLLSTLFGVFNSLGMSAAGELSSIFSDNCHICHKAPCICDFKYITDFKS